MNPRAKITPTRRRASGELSDKARGKKEVVDGCDEDSIKKTRESRIHIDVEQQNGFPYHIAAQEQRTYVVPKDALDPIFFTATTGPNNSAEEWGRIVWTVNGGFQVLDGGKKISVAGNATGLFTVTATLDGESDSINLWVFWATVDIITAGAIPAGCNLNFDFERSEVPENPRDLGPYWRLDRALGVGRICARATFQPAGIRQVLTANLKFCRRIDAEFDCADGRTFGGKPRTDHTKHPSCLQMDLTAQEEIFDLDAPCVYADHRSEFFNELRINFTQWVTFRHVRCSNEAQWHFIGELLAYPPAHLEANPTPSPQQMPTPDHANKTTVVRLIVGTGHILIQPNRLRYEKTGSKGSEIILNHGEY
jgi:hypothetical protein